jgi:hypothetical protein
MHKYFPFFLDNFPKKKENSVKLLIIHERQFDLNRKQWSPQNDFANEVD